MIINSGCLFLFLIFTILLSFFNFQLNWPKFTLSVATSLFNKISADLIKYEPMKIKGEEGKINIKLSKISYPCIFEQN